MEKSLRNASTILFLACLGFGILSCATPGKGRAGPPEQALAKAAEKEEMKAFSEYMAGEKEAGQRETGPLTPAERSFIKEYVGNMTCSVGYKKDSPEDPDLLQSGVDIVVKALAEESVQTMDVRQIHEKQGAEIYIEIDAATCSEYRGGGYWGQADIILTIFSVPGGIPLGWVPYNSPETFYSASEFDARDKALLASIYRAVPMALNQAAVGMAKVLEKGIAYTLLILNTPDPGMLTDFRGTLRKGVRYLRTVSAGPEETSYEVHLIGSMDDLEHLVYAAAETIPGFEKIERVISRGKSITFTTGL